MKIEKVTYQKTYSIGPYLTDRVGFEASLDEPKREEDGSFTVFTPEGALSELEKMADAWHRKNHSHLYQSIDNGPNIQTVPYAPASIPAPPYEINVAHERLEIEIDNCETVDDLKEWKKKNLLVPVPILTHWNNRLKQLMNGQ